MLNVLVNEAVCSKGFVDLFGIDALALTSGEKGQEDKVLGIGFDFRHCLCPHHRIPQLHIILHRIKRLHHEPIHMQHHKPLIGNFTHIFRRIRQLKINKFFFVKINPYRINQLYYKVFNSGVLLLLLVNFEEGVFNEEVIRGLEDKTVDILLVDEGREEGDCTLKSSLYGADCLYEGLPAATD